MPTQSEPENLLYKEKDMYLQKVIILALLLLFSYFLGQSQCQVTASTQQLEEIKNVRKVEKKVLAQPSASKSELLKLMRNGKF